MGTNTPSGPCPLPGSGSMSLVKVCDINDDVGDAEEPKPSTREVEELEPSESLHTGESLSVKDILGIDYNRQLLVQLASKVQSPQNRSFKFLARTGINRVNRATGMSKVDMGRKGTNLRCPCL